MTREEAITELNTFKIVAMSELGEKALDMAITALEQEPCTDAISRQAAINVAIDAVDDWDGGCNLSREEYIRKALERLRPVTPAEKVGQWEWVQYDGNPNIGNWHCSECRLIVDVPWKKRWSKKPEYNYCPNCGAKMGGEQNE